MSWEPGAIPKPLAEYVDDTAYPRNFAPQLSPAGLRLVAALSGIEPPPEDDFDYCELGMGNGDTLAVLAAANPRARFVGVDLNPEHVACAEGLARRGELTNLRVLQRDFSELVTSDLPLFDFVGAHGVLSWVSPSMRASVMAFAQQRLKPGGLLYASYNALPGWTSIEPMRRLMREHVARVLPENAPSLDRAREALDLLQRLLQANAAYFGGHPVARTMVTLMQKGGLNYVVHEYFHAHWHPMYFADLAREMGAHGLQFAGQLPLYLNVRELAAPPALRELTAKIEDRVAFESLKDFATNELFRSDVYMKTPVTRADAVGRGYFERTPFGTLASNAHVKRQVKLPHYTLNFTGGVYDPLVPAIASGAGSAIDLARRPELAAFGAARIGGCLQNLAIGNQAVPMRPWPKPAEGAGRKLRHAILFNEGVVVEGMEGAAPLVLASPVTGGGVTVSLLEAVCLRLLTEMESADRPAWMRALAARPKPLVIGDKAIKEPEKLVRALTKELESFEAAMVPKLLELGVIERV